MVSSRYPTPNSLTHSLGQDEFHFRSGLRGIYLRNGKRRTRKIKITIIRCTNLLENKSASAAARNGSQCCRPIQGHHPCFLCSRRRHRHATGNSSFSKLWPHNGPKRLASDSANLTDPIVMDVQYSQKRRKNNKMHNKGIRNATPWLVSCLLQFHFVYFSSPLSPSSWLGPRISDRPCAHSSSIKFPFDHQKERKPEQQPSGAPFLTVELQAEGRDISAWLWRSHVCWA